MCIVCMRIVLPCHSWSTTEPEHRVYENCLTLSFMKYHRARTTIFPISNSITIMAYWNKNKCYLLPFIQNQLGMRHIRKKLFPVHFRGCITCVTHAWKPPLQIRIQISNCLRYCPSHTFKTSWHYERWHK